MIVLDYRDKRPLYEQVEEKLTELIAKGILTEDEKLPSVRMLAIELAINPNTVQRAYKELEASGFIYTVQGRGNFVSKSDTWAASKQMQIIKEIEELILQAMSFGVTKDKLLEIIDIVCEKEVMKDDLGEQCVEKI